MKILSTLPVTAEQSRAARFQLGLTQSQVIEQSQLAGYKLKQFETGRFVPDMPFLQGLHDFYEGLGIDFSDAPIHGESGAGTTDSSKLVGGKPGGSMIRTVQRPCFYVSEDVRQELLDQCLERMQNNDERISSVLKKSLTKGLLGYHQETEQEHQELFGAMAENYLIFRLLQGNPIVQPSDGKSDPKTHADLLAQFYAKSPVANVETEGSSI